MKQVLQKSWPVTLSNKPKSVLVWQLRSTVGQSLVQQPLLSCVYGFVENLIAKKANRLSITIFPLVDYKLTKSPEVWSICLSFKGGNKQKISFSHFNLLFTVLYLSKLSSALKENIPFSINLLAFHLECCFLIGHTIHDLFYFNRNSAVFYWKFANLIGSLTVFYSLIENSRRQASSSLRGKFLDICLHTRQCQNGYKCKKETNQIYQT